MPELRAIALEVLKVHGGEKNTKSVAKSIAGIAWNPMSAIGAISISGGTTKLLSMALIPQYRILISTSKGAEHSERVFLTKKRVGESVMSARKPAIKVKYATVRPRMVKYCQCHPYESLMKVGKSVRYLKDRLKERMPIK